MFRFALLVSTFVILGSAACSQADKSVVAKPDAAPTLATTLVDVQEVMGRITEVKDSGEFSLRDRDGKAWTFSVEPSYKIRMNNEFVPYSQFVANGKDNDYIVTYNRRNVNKDRPSYYASYITNSELVGTVKEINESRNEFTISSASGNYTFQVGKNSYVYRANREGGTQERSEFAKLTKNDSVTISFTQPERRSESYLAIHVWSSPAR